MNKSGWRTFLGAAALAVAGIAAAPCGLINHAAAQQAETASGEDELIFQNGRVVKGRIVSETATEIRFEVRMGGISAPATYQKAEILTIKRAEKPEDAEAEADAADGPSVDDLRAKLAGSDKPFTSQSGAPTVYFMPLRGAFGRDISTNVIEQELADAKRFRPDYLIIELDRDWNISVFDVAPDDLGADSQFDEFTVTEAMEAIFTDELPRTWDKIPHIVVWVKSAMGGAAFLPFIADDIFFHPDGRMGGIGNLGELFEGTGDHVVRQKQRSLRLGMAQGMAIAGGYDYRLVTAMAIRKYELAYRLQGGKAVLFEGVASAPNEVTLTDNGQDGNADSGIDLVRGTGDDVLTLKAESAKLLGVSRGDAATLDDVLAGLGILRNHEMVPGRGERIMASWQEEMDKISRDLPKLWQEYQSVAVGRNGVRDANQALGTQESILRDIKAILERYGSALQSPENFFTPGQPPPPAYTVPQVPQINVMLEQIKVQRMMLRP